MGDAIDHAREATTETLNDASHTAKDALANVAQSTRGNPIALGLGAIAVGILVGLLVPITPFERENFGPIGSRLTNRAKDSANEIVARGRSAVGDVVSAAFKPSANERD